MYEIVEHHCTHTLTTCQGINWYHWYKSSELHRCHLSATYSQMCIYISVHEYSA